MKEHIQMKNLIHVDFVIRFSVNKMTKKFMKIESILRRTNINVSFVKRLTHTCMTEKDMKGVTLEENL